MKNKVIKTLLSFCLAAVLIIMPLLLAGCSSLEYTGMKLDDAIVGAAYICDLATATGSGERITYALAEGSTLPAGLAIENGELCGVPEEMVENHEFTVSARSGDLEAQATFTITVNKGELVYPASEANCIINVENSASVAFATGANDITYELIGGTMPNGLEIASDGTIVGSYPREMKGRVVTVKASANGCDPVEAEITINVVSPFLEFEGKTLVDAKAGVEYAASVAYVTDKEATVTYKLGEGVLPDGLTLSRDGIISGTPVAVQRGTPFTVIAEAAGYSPTEATFKIDVIIDHKSAEQGEILNFKGGEMTTAYQNEYYLNQAGVSDGVVSLNNNNITYTLAEGSELPEGLVLHSNGAIFGKTDDMREATFDVIARADGCEDVRQTFTLKIQGSKVKYDTALSADMATRGEAYTYSVATAYAGEAPVTYTLDSKASETLQGIGLSMDSAGLVTGIPSKSVKSLSFTVTASAEGYSDATCTVYLRVQEPLTETTIFEAEYLDLAGKTGVGYSGAPADEGLICRNENASGDFFLGYLHSPNMYFEYEIYAESTSTAELIIAIGQELGDNIAFDPATMEIQVNGTSIDYGSFTVPGARQSYTTFNEFSVGQVELKAGINTVRITIKPNQLFGGDATGGPGLDYIRINGASTPLKWRPCVYNFDAVVV